MSIRCDESGGEYTYVLLLAWTSVALYPLGAMIICGVLLLRASKAILKDDLSPLSQALSFMHKEYRPAFFWSARMLIRVHRYVTTHGPPRAHAPHFQLR